VRVVQTARLSSRDALLERSPCREQQVGTLFIFDGEAWFCRKTSGIV